MEKVFSLGWFNAMQHLLVHLPWKAKVGGHVQFRWMYSQDRELKNLELQCVTRQGWRGVLQRHSRSGSAHMQFISYSFFFRNCRVQISLSL
jgi:hypothetical protein